MNEHIIHKWKVSKGTLNYIGEWHTHNCAHPIPSNLDIFTTKEILKRDSDLKKIYLFIIGCNSTYIGEVTQSSGELINIGRIIYNEEND